MQTLVREGAVPELLGSVMALVCWPAHSCPGKAHSHPYKKGMITELNLYSLALNSAPSEVGRGSLCSISWKLSPPYFTF